MSFFSNIKELFHLKNTLSEKQQLSDELDARLADKQGIIDEVKASVSSECEEMRGKARLQADEIIHSAQEQKAALQKRIDSLEVETEKRISQLSAVSAELAEQARKRDAESKKYLRLRDAYKSIQYAVKNFDLDGSSVSIRYDVTDLDTLLSPTVELRFHSQDLKDLRKRANDVHKQILAVQKTYESRYTTKTARAMYQFMTLALSAELQNILYNLKYDKLDKNLESLKKLIAKFETIAIEGNQSIAPTIRKFLLQMDSLFADLIKIEYEFYVQQEHIKEEQRALREQMREEAADRRELERQQKQLEKEESKYTTEIASLKEQAQKESDTAKADALQKRVAELEAMVQRLNEKREEIVNRANGKAGYVYVISNLGSFGEDVFKVGMTRRLEPQDRVNELGDASVPFSFDVHSFIFSDDAVGLEAVLHEELNERRVNKINYRKEFFRVSLDELEQIVFLHQPSAAFSRTMLAEQYRQTLAIEQHLIEFDPNAQELPPEEDDE